MPGNRASDRPATPPRSRGWAKLLAIQVAGLGAIVVTAFALTEASQRGAADESDLAQVATVARSNSVPMPSGHAEEHPEVNGEGMPDEHPSGHPPPTASAVACVAELTAQARSLTLRLVDYATAVAEGYGEPARPRGTHHPNIAYKRDGAVFDLAHPESAIYRTRPDGSKQLVGVLYHAPIGEGPTPCGDATSWHTHASCMDPSTRATAPAGDGGACADGLLLRPGRVEMLHLWFVPRRART